MLFDRFARDTAEAQLESGETLLWFGRPNPMSAAQRRWPYLLIGLPWAGITGTLTIYWLTGPMTHPASTAPADTIGMGLTLLVFWVAALALAGVPLGAYLVARQTVYAVTNLRVIVFSPSRATSWSRGQIERARVRERRDFSGDLEIVFATADGTENTTFIGIHQPHVVEALLASGVGVP